MNKKLGFTLVELIVVIIILAILAVTAFPRMMNMQKEATRASIQGLGGGLKAAVQIVNGKAMVAGVENSKVSVEISMGNGQMIWTQHGYPSTGWIGQARSLALLDAMSNRADFSQVLGATDWLYSIDNNDLKNRGAIYIAKNNKTNYELLMVAGMTSPISNKLCYVVYYNGGHRSGKEGEVIDFNGKYFGGTTGPLYAQPAGRVEVHLDGPECNP